MKLLEKYEEYQLDMIFESVKNDTSMLVISDTLENKLKRISDPIAKKILDISNKNSYNDDLDNYLITLLDVNNKKDMDGNDVLDSISFYQSNKVIQRIADGNHIDIKRGEELAKPNRIFIYNLIKRLGFDIMSSTTQSETTLGRIVRKLFDTEFKDHEIGEFVEKYKAVDLFDENYFELVKGQDIVYWYNGQRYVSGSGPLNESCMRYERCGEYLEFYANNEDKVNLLILKDEDEDDKIIGRALVWKVDVLNGIEVKDVYFMDRIYYTREYIKELFLKYATHKSWLYKKHQNMELDVPIVNSKTNEEYTYVVLKDIKDNDSYPYMDTLKYYDGDVLTNDINSIDKEGGKKLEDTYGDYNGVGYYIEFYDEWVDVENDDDYNWCEWIDDYRYYEDRYYSDFYEVDIANDYIEGNMVDCGEFADDEYDSYRLPEDAFYSKFYKSYIADDFKSSMVKCDYYDYLDENDAYRLEKDTVEIEDKISTIDFAEEHFKYDKHNNEWFKEGVWSELYNTYINKEKAILVIVNKETGEKDWRYTDDETWYYDEDKHKYYAN